MAEQLKAGRVRALGVSNFNAAQLREANATAPIAAVQNHFNLLVRKDDGEGGVLAVARELNIAYIPYYPLASGLLTGKYRRDAPPPQGTRLEGREFPDEHWDAVESLSNFASQRGHTLHELAIAGLLAQPGITSVIAGATSPGQVAANAAAAQWTLSDADITALPRFDGLAA
jgi:aryl-alcohol dehydrogenase-like predicted oxidoreductase